ncbi:PEP-CTERM sorting domain-containing protein [Glaciecola sp. MF2-115]|uniref:PEP-CTERM sorting domain-containing protein n=1 Tax=Glaciecola sp. MF2-115 TaxID=3384827 RepID=UPI0039A2C6A2
MKFLKLSVFLCVALLLNPVQVMATIITFDDIDPVFVVPEDYGSNISVATGSFLEGNGFTPNVAVSYLRDSTAQNFSVWDGYSTLDNALGHNSFAVPGEMILTPDAGFVVRLNEFDFAAWSGEYNARITIFSGPSNILFDSGNFILNENQGVQNYTFSTPLESTNTIRIRFENFGDLAIDNINFDQRRVAVPEPSSLALLALGFLTFRRLKSKRGSKGS